MIARESRDEEDVVQVELRHDGHVGYGEAAPIDRYDETASPRSRTSRSTVRCSATTRSRSRRSRRGCRPGENAAKAALDGALHDLQGKLLGVPVWKLLGPATHGPPTSWTVWLGDPDDMARRAEKAATRFQRLKLKLGGGDGLDVERVRAVRARHRRCRCRWT